MEGSLKMQTGSDVLNMWITASIKASDAYAKIVQDIDILGLSQQAYKYNKTVRMDSSVFIVSPTQ